MNVLKLEKKEIMTEFLNFNILENIDFQKGDLIRVYGSNGVGKTTFFELICDNTKRKIHFSNDTEIFYIPQNYEDLLFTGRKVGHFLINYLSNKLSLKNKIAEEIVIDFFDKYKTLAEDNYRYFDKKQKTKLFDWKDFKNKKMNTLSGGQKRLLYIIREFIIITETPRNKKQKVLFLDEPFNDLDLQNKKFAIKLIKEIRMNDPELIIFIITHMSIIEGLNRVLYLENNNNSVSIMDDTKNRQNLLKICKCLFEE
jgi:ABC-type multidrug transport system ATPase subunit